MAHIPDGVLNAPVLVTGAALSALFLTVAVKKLEPEKIPPAAVLAAAFFISTLLSVPVGPTSVHLILNGVMGMLLGWTAFPAILVALLMQTLFFGHGGLLSLGVNVFNIALPALLIGFLLKPVLLKARPKLRFLLGMLAGGGAVSLTALMLFGSLLLTGDDYQLSGQVILVSYLPLVVVEAIISGVVLSFVMKVAPHYLK